ncbi:dihydrolipoamide acetyltransferase family protein [Mycobacterium haemophilum]|uniref:Dihydrolipoamide acetyltransferase component of pyruvate dehydrogenase complex n=1 Tax=Mycobacterium haemophilum TaxID=29311 RepID=A0A0I9YYF5_9MYCO|nr:dihydrolipoamide acetyltransferase family protein [Mycobacterium haemophilum]KLO33517.1 branched-chain alpha-keto acid dehydrogenase subunit E2 [Mycobacterium haemophilum]KLO39043.1 branched-chain alpha-keto acid dehydrogenase subunit E2 [Mycobacterium haemophilum]KLO45457.1 branched-chain alpha-keto acid dehydrogenase subunit E2 [Mycobacterium haemophilum]KLO56609.1 branched-chain alpha-keto acid dehydrogenase subunit E2 [Mycobacterium haemophilum]
MIEFTMPALGSDMDEGTLDEWLIKPGDKVKRGQVVAVVETTKAAVEIECWHEGTVHELLVPVGETVQVGTVLATLLAPGEKARRPRKVSAKPAAAAAAAPRRRWVSPAARRLAASLGVDVETVSGTGAQGAVTIGDVEHAAASIAKPKAQKPSTADRAAQMRRSIAAAMSRSKREIPHYYLADEIVMENALNWLTARNAERSITERVLPAVLQLKAVALAAQRFGEFNGFWCDDAFQRAEAVHVGVAISLRGGGLVAPAIHDVADKKLDELMSDLTDLVARARAFSLRSSEMSDPTITVTNLGDQGVDTVFGVIYPPQVALVGFGKPAQRVCVIDRGIRVVTTVQGTLAADHRASDGHRGAMFLAAINELLQQPDVLEK